MVSSTDAVSAVIAGLFAGVAATAVTVSVEKLGGRLGGVLATSPSTIIPASIAFWNAADSLDGYYTAILVTPVGMVANAAFLQVWRLVPAKMSAWDWDMPRIFVATIAASLLLWLAMAGAIVGILEVLLDAAGIPGLLGLALAGVACTVCMGLQATWRAAPAPAGKRRVGALTLLARGVAATLSVGASVLVSRALPAISGLLSIFPVIFMTAMVALWISQGNAVPLGSTGPMLLGLTSVPVYSLLHAATAPSVGPWWAALIAWAIAVLCVSYPARVFIEWRAKEQQQQQQQAETTAGQDFAADVEAGADGEDALRKSRASSGASVSQAVLKEDDIELANLTAHAAIPVTTHMAAPEVVPLAAE